MKHDPDIDGPRRVTGVLAAALIASLLAAPTARAQFPFLDPDDCTSGKTGSRLRCR